MEIFSKIKKNSGIDDVILLEGIKTYLLAHQKMPPFFGVGYFKFISRPEIWDDVRFNFEFRLGLQNSPKTQVSKISQIEKNQNLIKCLQIQLIPQLKENDFYQVPWEEDTSLINFQNFSKYMGRLTTINICKKILSSTSFTSQINPFEEKISRKYLENMVYEYLKKRKNKSILVSDPMLKLGAYLFSENLFLDLERVKSQNFKNGLVKVQKNLEENLRVFY